MEWATILALAIGILVVLFPLAYIWYINVGGILIAINSWKAVKQTEKAPSNLMCSIDSDCPPGYVCLNGRCMPQKA